LIGSAEIFPDVAGMRQNVYWLHHTNLEQRSEKYRTQRSYGDAWDVEMIHKLVQHIFRQVYRYEEIAVLTPYTEQERILKEKLGKGNAFSDANDQRSIAKKSNVIPDQRNPNIDYVSQF
jgi:hypothetical protein